jgi:uncharacterized membrane protein
MEWDALPLVVLMRWVHVGTAIVVLGGSVFMRFVLMPAAAPMPEADHDALRGRIMGRWKRFVMMGIALFLISGFYNYLVVAVPGHKGDGLYHGLMGTKILLAFVVFFFASALTGRSKGLEGIRRNSRKWLAVTILLAAIVSAIGGFLKVARPAGEAAMPAAVEAP